MARLQDLPELDLAPTPDDERLTASVQGTNQSGETTELRVVTERPLTIYLNAREIVTAMTIGDHPDLLAIGFLRNQGMIPENVGVTGVDYDDDLGVVVVRTDRETDFEEKLKKKTRTSGCAVGTVFGDMMDGLEGLRLPKSEVRTSWLYTLSNKINRIPSLYLEAGAIHGTVLCVQDKPLTYIEDVGRHNAVDKVAGWMFLNATDPTDKILYTTGRLTSEMVLKTAHMGIPVLVSRSGFTAWGVELARQFGMTLIGRLRGKRFICVSGQERVVFDADPADIADENRTHRRKGAEKDE
ncbi:formate dehydrogenase accessory sulfurtransferase FdhD [Aliiruegeria lutimaris]|uniref:Sulfur carrier protein FdhD n=1 Tax=Aliiruegeria lutimaris TaxID=571298 RepID=A0A1G9CXN6_9RHOB|nr:formate dehydrogenase accessory sulfurtransferase FdhD [Aliiruegeria lutimaris]SDK56383.1 FdhD protein [Aliiruegeria lutimaris]